VFGERTLKSEAWKTGKNYSRGLHHHLHIYPFLPPVGSWGSISFVSVSRTANTICVESSIRLVDPLYASRIVEVTMTIRDMIKQLEELGDKDKELLFYHSPSDLLFEPTTRLFTTVEQKGAKYVFGMVRKY
jgi:hypothetical protein